MMERSLYWYIGSLRILTNTSATALATKQVARQVLFPLFNKKYPIIANKDDLTKKQSHLVSVITTKASHKYPRGRDQNKYKFTVRSSKQ